ncbi:hypothetical protein TNCV_3348341 [Trichonephila clavipes]|nr:hypothetical protein TNCV_3348341 [Trichonephila clavipes]
MSQHELPSKAERLTGEPACFSLRIPNGSPTRQAPGTFCKLSVLEIDKIYRLQPGSNSQPMDYEANTLPLSYRRRHVKIRGIKTLFQRQE